MSGMRIDDPEVTDGSAEQSLPAPEHPDMGNTARESPHDLKRNTARGALVSVIGQGASFLCRTGSMIVIARLVTPEQFGLVGMVTAVTGFLGLFRDIGLSMATVQRASITQAQVSTLFWINLAVGGILAGFCALLSPLLAGFYHEPRLIWVTIALGTGFIFNGAAAQHRALLQRNMRFGVLVTVDVIGMVAGIVVGIWMAAAGMGYWALVVMSLCTPAVSLVGMWLATSWVPGMPQRNSGVRSMLHYGGVITLNSLVVYLVYNTEKILLGRFAGAEVLGIYGRAYQLITLPSENLNTAMGWVMFPALSRVQNDPERLRNYFLKGYSLFLSVVIPITVTCALFADDIILVLLGPKWTSAIPVFRLLTPTVFAFALINPLASLMQACGLVTRSLKISFLIAPVVVTGYVIGLPYGSQGVALGFSAAMMLLVVPVILWARHGTLITAGDMVRTVMRPFISALLGAAVAFAVWKIIGDWKPLPRIAVVTTVLFGIYALILLFGLGQKEVYLDFLRASGIRSKGGSAR